MKKSRGVVAGVAMSVLVLALLIGADAVGNALAHTEYRYELAGAVIAGALVVSIALFAWNVLTYKKAK
jgi:hypothetical protein